MARFLAGGRLDDIVVNNIAFNAGTSYYIPIYSFNGGSLTQIDVGVNSKGSNLSALQWEVLSYNGGSPGNTLASGSVQGSSITAGQWLSITVSGVSLDARTWYLLMLTPVGDTFTIQSYAHGWSTAYWVIHSNSLVCRILTWSGSAWTLVGNRYLSLICRVGDTWYGNPFTAAGSVPSGTGDGAGNSYLLTKPVSVVGAHIMLSNNAGTFTVNLYECGYDYLPVGSPVRSVTVPQTVPTVYWEPYESSRFSIVVVDGSRNLRHARDAYSSDDSRLNAVCPEIRAVANAGSGWQIATVSGRQVVVAGIYPILEYDGYSASGGGSATGFPFPPHVIIT